MWELNLHVHAKGGCLKSLGQQLLAVLFILINQLIKADIEPDKGLQ